MPLARTIAGPRRRKEEDTLHRHIEDAQNPSQGSRGLRYTSPTRSSQHPRATEHGAERHPGDARQRDTICCPLHRRPLRHRARPGQHQGPVRKGQGAARMRRLARRFIGRPDPGAYAGANTVPAGQRWLSWAHLSTKARPSCAPRPPRCSSKSPASTACARGAPARPGVHNPGTGQLGPPRTPGPGCSGGRAVQPHHVPQGIRRPATVPQGQRCHAAHRQAAASRHMPPDVATHNAIARAPRAAGPLLGQQRPMASSGAEVPQPVR